MKVHIKHISRTRHSMGQISASSVTADRKKARRLPGLPQVLPARGCDRRKGYRHGVCSVCSWKSRLTRLPVPPSLYSQVFTPAEGPQREGGTRVSEIAAINKLTCLPGLNGARVVMARLGEEAETAASAVA